jgi:hypothetical protein
MFRFDPALKNAVRRISAHPARRIVHPLGTHGVTLSLGLSTGAFANRDLTPTQPIRRD